MSGCGFYWREPLLLYLSMKLQSTMIKQSWLSMVLALLCLPAWATSEVGSRAYWIERYLSVSYPLKSVRVNSPYGIRHDPFTGSKVLHNGLDLRAYYENVYAMFDGKVQKTGSDGRSGNYVVIAHGVYMVSYCHLSKVLVAQGDEVLAGDVIGISGNTGRSTGPHLHLTCRHKGEQTDPYTLLLYINRVRAEAFTALSGGGGTPERVDCQAFLSRYAHAAMAQQQQYGIPASVTLSQMAFESAWGQSELARKGNNYFGIKCSRQWLAEGRPYSLHNDDKPNEKFCNYSTVEESIKHHSLLLMSDRYSRCRSFSPTDYHNWLLALKASGYATAKDYVPLCEQIIKRYKLYLYDRMAEQG